MSGQFVRGRLRFPGRSAVRVFGAVAHSLARSDTRLEHPPANGVFARWFLNRVRMFDSCRGILTVRAENGRSPRKSVELTIRR
jgi:hypothetical protein